jgi:hypothetical protein
MPRKKDGLRTAGSSWWSGDGMVLRTVESRGQNVSKYLLFRQREGEIGGFGNGPSLFMSDFLE